jgi:hypothetical protein
MPDGNADVDPTYILPEGRLTETQVLNRLSGSYDRHGFRIEAAQETSGTASSQGAGEEDAWRQSRRHAKWRKMLGLNNGSTVRRLAGQEELGLVGETGLETYILEKPTRKAKLKRRVRCPPHQSP